MPPLLTFIQLDNTGRSLHQQPRILLLLIHRLIAATIGTEDERVPTEKPDTNSQSVFGIPVEELRELIVRQPFVSCEYFIKQPFVCWQFSNRNFWKFKIDFYL